jgi:predicted MPP superfamily phosphohydrolase
MILPKSKPRCPYCAVEISESGRFCPKCGVELTGLDWRLKVVGAKADEVERVAGSLASKLAGVKVSFPARNSTSIAQYAHQGAGQARPEQPPPPKADLKSTPTLGASREGPMTSFAWLHLTDLHWGMHEQSWLWPRMKEKFFQDLESLHPKSGPWDLVLFTGDLAYKGSPEEFKKVDEVLDRLWEHLGKLGSKPVLLAVPGNHDLVRPKANQPEVEVLRDWSTKPKIQQLFWDDPKSDYRRVVKKAFRNYLAWWEKQPLKPPNVRSGMLPGDFSVSIKKETAQLGIVGLNTTFLQLAEGEYKGKLALSARQFHNACGDDAPEWVKKNQVCLLLTHQPPDWLSHESREELNTEIADPGQFAAHLFGHMHEACYTVTGQGGAELRRFWQGRSLFGMERFVGKSGKQVERIHGYSAGKVELRNDGTASLTFWPREAINLKGNKRKMVPDNGNYDLTDEHTKPEIISLLRSYEHIGQNPPVAGPSDLTNTVNSYVADLADALDAIQRLENEHRHILVDAENCNLDQPAEARALRVRIDTYLKVDEIRPQLACTIGRLSEAQESIRRLTGTRRWRRRDRTEALDNSESLLKRLKDYLGDLEKWTKGYTGVGVDDLLQIKSELELAPQEVRDLAKKINDEGKGYDLKALGNDTGRVQQLMRAAFVLDGS